MIISMLGEGAWGTAIALLLANNGHQVKMWCYKTEVVDQVNISHENRSFFPGFTLPDSIKATDSIQEATRDAEWIFEAVPVQFLRQTITKAKDHFNPTQKWVILSKGIEQHSLQFPSQIIADVLGKGVDVSVLAGPSFAKDVASKKITAVTVAASDCDRARQLQALVANDYFRPYMSTDVLGVQICAALKNVITLGIGILDGAGYTDNTKAFLMTRGLHEMAQLVQQLGGKQETMYGLAGVGDLVLTAFGSLSKNLKVGQMLGSGQSLDQILKETGFVPEGINSVQSIHQLIKKNNSTLPICEGIYELIFEQVSLEAKLKEFMRSPLIAECETV